MLWLFTYYLLGIRTWNSYLIYLLYPFVTIQLCQYMSCKSLQPIKSPHHILTTTYESTVTFFLSDRQFLKSVFMSDFAFHRPCLKFMYCLQVKLLDFIPKLFLKSLYSRTQFLESSVLHLFQVSYLCSFLYI